MLAYAPGARVLIRDEEWRVRRVDPSSDGGHLLTCDGVSERVRGHAAQFLTVLEDKIAVLDPAKTVLVADDSAYFNRSFLYLEAQIRRSTANDEHIHLAHRAVMNPLPFQLDPALQALKQARPRILMADADGLGKTLEAGILATELIQRGRGQRILVVAPQSNLAQFQKEFWSRFTLPLVRLDALGLQQLRNEIASHCNPFHIYDRSIVALDTLKNSFEFRHYLENAHWDIVIIDECHHMGLRGSEAGVSRRACLARLLAGRTDTLILLSATPHDGSARSFASLMSLLDPTAISDPDDYTPQDFRDKGLVVRRFENDISNKIGAEIPERIAHSEPLDEEDGGERLLKLFAPSVAKGRTAKSSTDGIHEGISLFGSAKGSGESVGSDYAFAKTALQQLSMSTPWADFTGDDTCQTLALCAPHDLQERLRVTLPLEVRDAHHRYTLCADPARVAESIEQAHPADEKSWPLLHYLWPQHPIMDWLFDRALAAFVCHCAPVIQCPALTEDEQAFVLKGLILNRKGQPLLVEWQVAVWNNEAWRLQAFPDFVARTQLKAGTLANRAQGLDMTPLQANLPGAVSTMQRHMVALQHRLAADMTIRLAGKLANLERLQGQQIEQLESRLTDHPQDAAGKKIRREQRKHQIGNVFADYRQWLADSLGTEPPPFIQVLAAVVR